MRVYLDDERPTPPGWVRVYTAQQTIEILNTGLVTHLSLDHDLGDRLVTGDGADVTKWLARMVFEDPTFRMPVVSLHTANPEGRRNMQSDLDWIQRFLGGS